MIHELKLLTRSAARARHWLLDSAAPLWARSGRTPSGLFAERLTLSGEPDDSYFRTFVQARHIYSFVSFGEMGWTGPWRELVSETVETLLRNAKRQDGFFVHQLDSAAMPTDGRADLYDQAFVLLALAVSGSALGRPELFTEAELLWDLIETRWGHPAGGFREGDIADAKLRRQNPHMHLLEALIELHRRSGRSRFWESALRIAILGRDRFVDRGSGALREYFELDLSPAAGPTGPIAEPGHCFEWAWLFEKLADLGWDEGTILSDQMTRFARDAGIDRVRHVAINEVLLDGSARDATARLWPQTERIKAAAARFRRIRSPAEAAEAVDAALGLEQYLGTRTKGLWRDKLREDGSWVEEMVPGSSLYHISCAYAELDRLFGSAPLDLALSDIIPVQ